MQRDLQNRPTDWQTKPEVRRTSQKRTRTYILGFHHRGGGGNFSKERRFVRKRIGTQKQFISGFLAAPCGELKKTVTLLQCILQQNNHVCKFSPNHERLDSAKKIEVQSIFGRVATVLMIQTR